MRTLDLPLDLPYQSISLQDDLGSLQPASSRKIPCQVCGAMSSGLHFGVFTCEGCKCFYRRSIREGANYACAKDRNCEITMETRNSCRFCRFQKCIGLGMSKEGIKLGRRPKVENEPLQHMCFSARRDVGSSPIIAGSPHALSWSPLYSGHVTHAEYKSHLKDMEVVGVMSSFGVGVHDGLYGMKQESVPQCIQCNDPYNATQYTYVPQAGASDDGSGYGQVDVCGMQQNVQWKMEVPHSATSCVQNNFPMVTCSSQTLKPVNVSVDAWQMSESSPSATSEVSTDDQWDGVMKKTSGKSPVSLTIPEVQAGAATALAYANLYRDTTVDRTVHSDNISSLDACTNDQTTSNTVHVNQSKCYAELLPRKQMPQENDMNCLSSWNGQYPRESSGANYARDDLPECEHGRSFPKNTNPLLLLSAAETVTSPTSEIRKRRPTSPSSDVSDHMNGFPKRRKSLLDDCLTEVEDDYDGKIGETRADPRHESVMTTLNPTLVERLINTFLEVESQIEQLWQERLLGAASFSERWCNKDVENFIGEKKDEIQRVITSYAYKLFGNFPGSIRNERAQHIIPRLCLQRSARRGKLISDSYDCRERATDKAAVLCALSLVPAGGAQSHQLNNQQRHMYAALIEYIKGQENDIDAVSTK